MIREKEIIARLWEPVGFIIYVDTEKEECSQTCLDERVDVQHESLSSADDELIDAGNGMRPATQ